METFIKKFEHLKIPFDDIKLATNNFDKAKKLGSGGFGQVYGGELSHSKGRSMVAIKCLNTKFGQGATEFWEEITILDNHTHENLVALLGFCIKGKEMFLVYEYACKKSLDTHLHTTGFKWTQRLKICIDAARGLKYLHDVVGTKKSVIHRDIKSANILVYENWNAKIADMGLSRIPNDQQDTGHFTNHGGTRGYCDPEYIETSFLSKFCDVYSFGVVLFEVLCGRLCCEYKDGKLVRYFVPMWKESYRQKKLQDIIFNDLKQQIDQNSLETYSNIAFKCLQESHERPTMPYVVKKLETALEYQELHEGPKLTEEFKNMLLTVIDPLNNRELETTHEDQELYEVAKMTEEFKKMLLTVVTNFLNNRKLETTHQGIYEGANLTEVKNILLTATEPLNDISESQLKMILLKGILVNRGKTWFSRNMNGDHCEMISIAACLTSTANEYQHYISLPEYSSRFAVGCYEPSGAKFKIHVRTQLLSPRITYTVNLVFKIKKNKKQYLVIEHKLKGEKETSYSFLSGEREDGWLTAELYRFTSEQETVDLRIKFYTKYCPNLLVEAIEFRPEKNCYMQSMSDKETYWKQKLPQDYEDIIKWSKDGVQWDTTKDLYYIFCKGFLLVWGEEWFSLNKDGKKCVMLSAIAALRQPEWDWINPAETRFKDVAFECKGPKFGIFCQFRSKLLSPQTTYGTYLVYKLPEGYKNDKPPPVQVKVLQSKDSRSKDSQSKDFNTIFLQTPQNPVINCNSKNVAFTPSNRPQMKGLPKCRSDGWMEVQVHEFQTCDNIKVISTRLKFSSCDMGLKGITVQCLEYRPV